MFLCLVALMCSSPAAACPQQGSVGPQCKHSNIYTYKVYIYIYIYTETHTDAGVAFCDRTPKGSCTDFGLALGAVGPQGSVANSGKALKPDLARSMCHACGLRDCSPGEADRGATPVPCSATTCVHFIARQSFRILQIACLQCSANKSQMDGNSFCVSRSLQDCQPVLSQFFLPKQFRETWDCKSSKRRNLLPSRPRSHVGPGLLPREAKPSSSGCPSSLCTLRLQQRNLT